MIVCPKCGGQLADGARFCKFCGYSLTQQQTSLQSNIQQMSAKQSAPSKKKSSKIVLIAVISIFLVAAIVLGIIFIPDLVDKKKEEDLSGEEKLTQILEESTTKPIVEFVYDDYDSDGTYEAYAIVGETDEEDEKHPEFYDADIYFVNHKKAQPIKENISGKVNDTIDIKDIKYISIEVYEDGTDEGKSFIYTVDGKKPEESDISGEYSNVHEENGRIVGFDENGNQVDVDFSATDTDDSNEDEFENIIEPTDEDWVEFETFYCNFLETYSTTGEFDYESPQALNQAHELLVGYVNSYIYWYFYKDNGQEWFTQQYSEETGEYWHEYVDPLGKFEDEYAYISYPAENLDWIIENVFNLTPDRNYSDEHCYYYDNSFYIPGGQTGSGYYTVDVVKYELLEDGRYEMKANLYLFDETNLDATVTAIVALKEIDGQKFWSVYKIERESAQNYY